VLLGLAAAVAAAGGYVAIAGNPLTRSQQAITYQTSAVKQGTVQVTVSASGPVTIPASVPLSFPNSGKLSEVDVSIGQSVSAGQVLAKLDPTALQIAVDQAQAALVQQQANLTKVAAGATPEAVAAAQAQIAAAQTTLDNAQKSLADAQATSTTAIASAQTDVSTAQLTLTASQQSLQSAQDQAQAALQVAVQAGSDDVHLAARPPARPRFAVRDVDDLVVATRPSPELNAA